MTPLFLLIWSIFSQSCFSSLFLYLSDAGKEYCVCVSILLTGQTEKQKAQQFTVWILYI